jgi:CO/xanthine dehydrogenase FAD-binding subunit
MDLTSIEAVFTPRDRNDLAGFSDGDAFLGGGTWLFSEPQPKLRRLFDLASLGWPALRNDASGLTIAATCRIAELFAFAPPVGWPAAGLIAQCCESLLGSFKIWNAATVGGNICLALPAGPMTALTASLDGVCTIWTVDGGERYCSVLDLVIGNNRNSLAPGEILRSVFCPAAALQRRFALRQIALNPLGRSAALLVATLDASGDFALTITAATPRPLRLDFAAIPTAAALYASIETCVTGANLWFDDIHGAPDWRRHITLHLAEQVRAELAGSA